MIAIVDYGVGNIRSVVNALQRAGVADPVLTSDKKLLLEAEKIVLPGVGDASCAMSALRDCDLAGFIPSLKQPVLGICVGMQLMCRHSQEGNVDCMGIFNTNVVKFTQQPQLKIPHMGWNAITNLKSSLFDGVSEGSFVYYVHSYYPELCQDTIAVSEHGCLFSGALSNKNFYGTQFHPEKSGEVGAVILKNFLAL